MKQHYILSISTLLLASVLTSVIAQTNVQDSLAIVDLYNSTNGIGWKMKTNWLSKQPINKWYGITVAGGNITVLTLNNNALRGNLPASFGNLSHLSIAHFEQDSLSGELPITIGNLKSLQILAFGGNNLSGSIPNSIGNLTNLSYLDFSFNQLSGMLPSEIGSMKNLSSLFLNSNKIIGGIPESIGNLTSLTYLYLDYNLLTDTIPQSIGNCRNLKTLSLSNNHISGIIPASICNLSTLFKLDLSDNQLIGSIPSSIGNISTLIKLSLNYNKLSGSIPNSIGKLTALTTLEFDHNQLSGEIPIEITLITGVINYPLNNNNFTFAGMEAVASQSFYSPQMKVPIKQIGNTLSVSVGGTPSNNTFKWYRNSTLIATTTSDSTFSATSIGKYWVIATNAVATQLILYSDTIIISTLPIESLSLKGTTESGQTLLQWHTKGETNVSNFEIEKSNDGINFILVGEIVANGRGNNSYLYSFSSKSDYSTSINNNSFYRIKAIDKDGNIAYSNSITISISLENSTFFIYPNPLIGSKEVHVNGTHIAEVIIYNLEGKVIMKNLFNNMSNPKIAMDKNTHGIYTVIIKQQDGTKRSINLICK